MARTLVVVLVWLGFLSAGCIQPVPDQSEPDEPEDRWGGRLVAVFAVSYHSGRVSFLLSPSTEAPNASAERCIAYAQEPGPKDFACEVMPREAKANLHCDGDWVNVPWRVEVEWLGNTDDARSVSLTAYDGEWNAIAWWDGHQLDCLAHASE